VIPARTPHRIAIGVVLAALALGCRSAQRVPGPMPLDQDPPPAPDFVGGQEVQVVRHSDGVRVRQAGAVAGVPLTFYRKKARVTAGGTVITTGTGRAELIWPGDASSIVLHGTAVVHLGDPQRDQPLLSFREVAHARLLLTPEDRIELPGGAILRGDPVYTSGPFILDLVEDEVLRFTNQSKREARIDYRLAVLELGPGDEVDLPLLPFGTGPLDPSPSAVRYETGIVDLLVTGRVEYAVEDTRVRVTAVEESEIEALGLRIRLAPGEEIVLSAPRPAEPGERVRGSMKSADERAGEDPPPGPGQGIGG